MRGDLKTVLLFVGILAIVVVSSFLYSRSLNTAGPVGAASTPLGDPALPESLHPQLEAGLQALREKRTDEALLLLDLVPEDDPGYGVALSRLGFVLQRSGDLDGSLARYERLADLQHENPQAQTLVAWAYFRVGRFRDAELAALRALELDPAQNESRYDVALYRLASGELIQGIAAYHRAMAKDSRGLHFERAFEDLRQLHGANPELDGVHYALAFFAKTRNRRQLEITELEHFLERNPEGPAVEYARAALEEAREVVGN